MDEIREQVQDWISNSVLESECSTDCRNLTETNDLPLSLLTNEEVIAVDQESSGNRQLFRENGVVAWVADVPNSHDKYLAVFNTNDPPRTTGSGSLKVIVTLSDLGFASTCRVRDLWRKTELGVFKGKLHWPLTGMELTGAIGPVLDKVD